VAAAGGLSLSNRIRANRAGTGSQGLNTKRQHRNERNHGVPTDGERNDAAQPDAAPTDDERSGGTPNMRPVSSSAMPSRPSLDSPAVRACLLGAVVLVAGASAIALHRHGHAQGDDFALYLRQARSIFDGDSAQVVADNRFSVVNDAGAFSPIAYPWGWPVLLSPFVKLWGFDYDRLKLVTVALMCCWLVLFHGIVRRRAGRALALGATAVLATAPVFLTHTDYLLSEYPYLVAVGVVVWWYDRVRTGGPLIGASSRHLVVLGVLASIAFNVRREGMVFFAVFAAVQFAEIAAAVRAERRSAPSEGFVPAAIGLVRRSWLTIVTPHAALVGSIIVWQFLLPTALFPDNGNSPSFIPDRFGDYPGVLARQIGLGGHPVLGCVVIAIAVVGAMVGMRRRPWLDWPLVVLAVSSAFVIGTHFRLVERYWFQVTPWVVYFAVVAVAEGARAVARRQESAVRLAIAVPLAVLVMVQLSNTWDGVASARRFNADGHVQFGPSHPAVIPVFDAVSEFTAPDAVITYYRARTMTLLTDRRAIQTTNLDNMRRTSDYYAQRKGSNYSQPSLSIQAAEQFGFEVVWEDDEWILWQLREP
jgi:hypothetical protein